MQDNLSTPTINGTLTHDAPPTPSIKPVKEAVAQESARLGELAKFWMAEKGEQCKQAADKVRHEALALNDRTQTYVRHEPVKSVLIAAAAGAAATMLLGLAMGRRR